MCEIKKVNYMVNKCNNCLKNEVNCVSSDKQRNECYYNNLLDELYNLTQLEYKGIKLTEEQSKRYIEIFDILNNANVEIPFGIEI